MSPSIKSVFLVTIGCAGLIFCLAEEVQPETTRAQTLMPKAAVVSPPQSAPRPSHQEVTGFLATFLDRQAGAARLPSDISGRLPVLTDPGQLAAVEAVLLDSTDDDAVRNEAINVLRRSSFNRLDADLVTILERSSETERFRSFCVQHLGMSLLDPRASDRDLLMTQVRAALTDRHLAVKREALLALARLRDGEAIRMVRQNLADPQWEFAQDLLVRCVYDLDIRDEIQRIRQAITAENESAQIAALYVVGQWKDLASLEQVRERLHAPNGRIREAAEMAWDRLQTPPHP